MDCVYHGVDGPWDGPRRSAWVCTQSQGYGKSLVCLRADESADRTVVLSPNTNSFSARRLHLYTGSRRR